jgi:hypothetical protein
VVPGAVFLGAIRLALPLAGGLLASELLSGGLLAGELRLERGYLGAQPLYLAGVLPLAQVAFVGSQSDLP